MSEIYELIKGSKFLFYILTLFIFWFLLKLLLNKVFKSEIKIRKRNIAIKEVIEGQKVLFYAIYTLFLALFTSFLFERNKLINYATDSFYSISTLLFFIFLYRSINKILEKIFIKEKDKEIRSFLSFSKSFTKFFFLILAFFQILLIWEVNITPLLASAGIAGIALALGAQQLLSNLFGGVNLFLDKSIKVGDKVIYNGRVLWVEEINIRTTKFRTLENTYLIVPNSQLANSVIENVTQPLKAKNVRINIEVAYGSDIEKVKKVLKKVAERNSKRIKDEDVEVWFYELGEYSLRFLVVFKVPSADDMWPARCEFIENVYKELSKEGIEIPYPIRTIYLK
ncbi:MAG TPA: mechanosensitive ion channel [Nautiliaceae bacterium]|nr:mechanosensitive ion channel [Nautiliaceae bacterium]